MFTEDDNTSSMEAALERSPVGGWGMPRTN
jgi:hypothetical protein